MDTVESIDDTCVSEESASLPTEPKVDNKRKQAVPRRSKKAPQATKTLVDGVEKRKKHRFRPGTVALREIRNMQRTTDLLIPRRTMRRLVRELISEQRGDLRVSKDAYESLHVAAENFITELFSQGMNMAVFAGRKSLELKDLRMAIEQTGISLSKEFMERARRIRKIN